LTGAVRYGARYRSLLAHFLCRLLTSGIRYPFA
jgi:hypothetical protein